MDFTLSSYSGRLVLNSSDIILQLEHTKTSRNYQQTFYDHSFHEYTQMGGIEFISRLLSVVLWENREGLSISVSHETPANVTLLLTYATPLFVKPVEFVLDLPAVRKTGSDLDVLERKLKLMTRDFQAIVEQLMGRIRTLEEKTQDFTVFPGCDFAIPTSLPSLKLILSGTHSLDCHFYSTAYPQMKAPSANPSYITSITPFGQQGVLPQWKKDTGAFAFVETVSIANLKHMRELTSLTLAGLTCSESEYEILGTLTNLTSLTIHSARNAVNSNPPTTTNAAEGRVTLTNLNWITPLKHLETLVLVGCTELVDITALKHLPNLKTLDIRETAVKNTNFLTSSTLKIQM